MDYQRPRTPRAAFQKAYGNSTNFFTPTIIEYFEGGPLFIELSKGTGVFTHEPIYGVTVLNYNGQHLIKELDKSQCFTKSEQEARNYIWELLEKYEQA